MLQIAKRTVFMMIFPNRSIDSWLIWDKADDESIGENILNHFPMSFFSSNFVVSNVFIRFYCLISKPFEFKDMILEVCTGSIESVLAARTGGAQRVELCSALAEGGVTPSVGLMREARKVEGIKLNVLIRPRGGDFLYTEEEVLIMEADVLAAREIGADGVVIGALTKYGDVDVAVCQRLVTAAGDMSVTFHRAFDMVRDPRQALEDVIALGCDRILTSGMMPTAEEGVDNLRALVKAAKGRIVIMPGSGVSPENVAYIINRVVTTEIHASARSLRPSLMEYQNTAVTMGAKDADEYARKETDSTVVAEIVRKMAECVV